MIDSSDELKSNTQPDWLSTAGIEWWEPDELIAAWYEFLSTMWERVEYI